MQYRDSILHFDDVPAAELIERFGSPLYVYEESILLRQLERVRFAFDGLPFQPAYALKANANLALLKIIASHGYNFDAVSPGEIFLLKQAGVTGDRIWFTCSNVSIEDLRAIDDPAIIINLNAMSDLDSLLSLKLKNRIAFRINPDVGAGHHKDVVTGGFGVKFGFDLAEVGEAIMIARDEGLNIAGLHAHIGSGVTAVEPLLESARTLLELSDSVDTLEYINFGGGLATPYRPAEADFPIDEYGSRLREMADTTLRARSLKAIVEPGRYLVAECGTLLTRVTSKRVSSGFEWLGCDTGFNHLARPSKYGAYHHIMNASRGDESQLRSSEGYGEGATPSILAGNICESGDVFTRSEDGLQPRPIAPTRVGDVLALCDAGAYGFSMASHYNARQLPAEVLVSNGKATLIRRRQTLDDLIDGMTGLT